MKKRITPTRDILEKYAQRIPEINPSSVIAMLRVLEASSKIQHAIIDVLEREYQLSEGKLCVMIILHQTLEGMAPSQLATQAGVTRATISVMLQRMTRDGLTSSFSDVNDGRGKKICLTEKGRNFMDAVLPEHYLRITNLMGHLSETEQKALIDLLKRIVIA